MHTTATIHALPVAAVTADRILKVRYLAQQAGCTYIPSISKAKARINHAPFDPNGGGRAA